MPQPNPQSPPNDPSNRPPNHPSSNSVWEEPWDMVQSSAQQAVRSATELLGETITPVVESPLFHWTARLPGMKWILAAVGQVNLAKIEAEIAQIRADHPLENAEELSDRIIKSAAITAGSIGLVTNIAPPLALTLLAVDLLAVTLVQAEMIFRIAALYGFPLRDPARRGEVLTVFTAGLATSSLVKAGLSTVELIPLAGGVIGATGNAALIYSLGRAAQQFYSSAASAAATTDATDPKQY